MMPKRATRIAVILVLAALLVWAAAEADRAIVAHLGPERGILVAAVLTGAVFFVTSVTCLEWAERRQARARSHHSDDADSP
jgi:hypothetical protein